MAMRISNSRTLASALRLTRTALVRRNEATRTFASTQRQQVVVSSETPNMRHAQRDSEPLGGLKAPIVNPADKYAAKADDMHRYGSWLMGCLPKYIQQFSVWKDELVIYISPAGVIPVFSFLKCMNSNLHIRDQETDIKQIILLPSLQQSVTSLQSIFLHEINDSKSSTTC